MKSIRNKRKSIIRKSLLRRLVFMYRLSVVNEEEQRQTYTARFSVLGMILFLVVFSTIVGYVAVSVYNHSPRQARESEQEYMVRRNIVDEALRLDSLESVLSVHERYMKNVQSILLGEINVDTVYSVDSLAKVREEIPLMQATAAEESFVQAYEEAERYNITTQTPAIQELKSLDLMRPTLGVLTRLYDPLNDHLGVDIAVSPNQSVVSVMDGTVLMSAFTAEEGYVVCVSHPAGMISIFSNLESVMCRSGEKVRQGQAIAIAGAGGLNTSPHLHFELWYMGQSIDPTKYILFQ